MRPSKEFGISNLDGAVSHGLGFAGRFAAACSLPWIDTLGSVSELVDNYQPNRRNICKDPGSLFNCNWSTFGRIRRRKHV